ncbi:MAG: OB-fold nucleic acid binding domain-containing protein [Candidatus Undinarchaeales archaeon]|jgi:RPA family protein|nr:OB-fold nucleic acid binding domain-containing protein [Candidatus Undinarchaeales archaeon]
MAAEGAALKLWVRDIVEGTFEPNENGYGGSIALKDGSKISKVRVLGTVVDKFVSDTKSFASATIDDSSETINVKLFKDRVSEIEKLELGDIIDVLGDINEYQGEVYVLPRALNKVDINWEMLRRIELNKVKGRGGAGAQGRSGEAQTEKLEEIILKKFEELGSGKGMKMETLIKDLKDVDENLVITAVQNLMHKGDMFEPKKGVLKLV